MQNLLGKVENKLEGMGLKMLVMRHLWVSFRFFMGRVNGLVGKKGLLLPKKI